MIGFKRYVNFSLSFQAKRFNTNTVAHGGVPKDGVLPLQVSTLAERDEREYCSFRHQCSTSARLGALRCNHAGKGGDAKPPTSYVQIGARSTITERHRMIT